MAGSDTRASMTTPARHVYGPRALSALLPGVTRPAYRRRAPAAAQLLADWAEIVGPGLARVTLPRRLAGGTLTLACAGPVALELQHLAGPLLERINTALGGTVVQRLRFTQDMAPPPPARAAAPAPDAAALAALEARLAGLPDGELRAALAALGRRVAAGG